MSKQQKLPEIDRSEAPIRPSRLHDFLAGVGANAAMNQLVEELEEMQKQHPHAVGLTLAIAIAKREAAQKQMDVTKEVLFTAATNGLPMDGHRIELRITRDGPVVISTADSLETATD